MASKTAQTAISPSGSDKQTGELDSLFELAKVYGKLRLLRADSATASADLRQRRSRLLHLETLLRTDSKRLASLRETGAADRVAVDILDKAVAGTRRDHASANDSAALASDSLAPLVERLSTAISNLERRARELRAGLSPATARIFDVLARRNISPPIATLEDLVCGECHLRLPTAFVSSQVAGSPARRCPHCKRILVPAARSELASAS